MNPVLVDMFGYIALGLGAASFAIKRRNLLLGVKATSNVFYGAHFWAQDAINATIVSAVYAFSDAFGIKKTSPVTQVNVRAGLIFIVVGLAVANSPQAIDYLPCAAAVASIVGAGLRNNLHMRLVFLLVACPVWLVYAIAIDSMPVILSQAFFATTLIIGILRVKKQPVNPGDTAIPQA